MQPREHSRRHEATSALVRLRSHLAWPVACWLFVLVAIGVVQLVRMQWFDATVFFMAAGGVAVVSVSGEVDRGGRRRMTLLVLSAGAAVLGAVMCFLPRHGTWMQLVVILVGFLAVLLAATGRAVAHPERQTTFSRGVGRLTIAWAVIVVIGCIWELVQFILGLVDPDAAWFSLSDLLDPLAGTVPGKIVAAAAWLAGGVWLLRRGGRR